MKVRPSPQRPQPGPAIEICVLAGGLSSRMGRDKSRLRLGGRTFLGHLRQAARSLGLPIRVIRQDLIPRAGPLGGIFTGLKTTRAAAVLFLACDMPLVPGSFLRKLIRKFPAEISGLAVSQKNQTGFPMLIRPAALPLVIRELEGKDRSIHSLFLNPQMKTFGATASDSAALININTPAALKEARAGLRRS